MDSDNRGWVRILSGPPAWLFSFLFPLSVLYRLVISLNRCLYGMGIRRARGLPRPVVSIGNIAVGGGGKTPLVIWLGRRLAKKGLRVAVLTRGYGGRAITERPVEIGKDMPSRMPDQVGDEAVLLAKNLPRVSVFVSANRYLSGMQALENREIDIFLLDDGFQHFALKRDLDLVVVDNERRFGNGRLLPSGILREPVSRLKDADIIVVTKARNIDPDFGDKLSSLSDAPVLWADYRPTGIRAVGKDSVREIDELKGRPLLAFSGIANPLSFESTLSELSLEVVDRVRYGDHHLYSNKDVHYLTERAASAGAAAMITTEKDLVRWPAAQSSLPCYALPMEVLFLAGEDQLMARILKLTERGGRGETDG